MEEKCKHCQKDSDGYKCDVCGEEASEHDSEHSCGGEHCVNKCSGCSESETNCNCD